MCITPSVDEAKAIKVGDPEEEDVFMGALNSKPHLEKVRRYIEYAVEDGGQAREFVSRTKQGGRSIGPLPGFTSCLWKFREPEQ